MFSQSRTVVWRHRRRRRQRPQPGSLLGPTSVAPGGVSGKFDVSFPPRNDSFDFRNQLETKYQTGLGRAAAPTFVDREGEVVWTQEYMRYRTNGCDHATATQRVMTQIDGQPAGAGVRRAARRVDRVSAAHRLTRFPAAARNQVPAVQPRRQLVERRCGRRRGLDAGIPALPRQPVRPPHRGSEGVFADRRRRRVADVLCAAVPVHRRADDTNRPGRRWHLHGRCHQDLGRQLHLRGREPRLVRVDRERRQRHRYDDTSPTRSRQTPAASRSTSHSRPMDQQLDAARDQPGRRTTPRSSWSIRSTDQATRPPA